MFCKWAELPGNGHPVLVTLSASVCRLPQPAGPDSSTDDFLTMLDLQIHSADLYMIEVKGCGFM